MRRVTLKEVADRLGLSCSTVCRGLRDHPDTSLETRRRIRAACSELGYRPDPVLSELGSTRWRVAQTERESVIAYITTPKPDADIGFEMSPFLQKEAAVWGFKVETFRREEFESCSKLEKILRHRGITDLIIGAIHQKSCDINFDWKKFIAIQLLPGFFPLPLHSVVPDHLNVVVMAWQKAVERGYRRIGAVLLDHGFPMMDDFLRLSGAEISQRRLFPHLEIIPPFTYKISVDLENFTRWANEYRPDVIIGFNRTHYVCFQSQFGRKIPYISLHKQPDDPLSGIDDNPAVYAKEAINLIQFCRKTHQWGLPGRRIDHVVEPTWFEGNTLPVKQSSVTATWPSGSLS
jgi:LacI family transcriptional regulator